MLQRRLPLLVLLAACRRDVPEDSVAPEDSATESPWEVVTTTCPLEPYTESFGVLARFDEPPAYVAASLCYVEEAADGETWCWQGLDAYLTDDATLITRSSWCEDWDNEVDRFEVAYAF